MTPPVSASLRAAIDDLSRNRAPRGSPDALVNSMAIAVGTTALPRGAHAHIFGGVDVIPQVFARMRNRRRPCASSYNFTFSMKRMYQPVPLFTTSNPARRHPISAAVSRGGTSLQARFRRRAEAAVKLPRSRSGLRISRAVEEVLAAVPTQSAKEAKAAAAGSSSDEQKRGGFEAWGKRWGLLLSVAIGLAIRSGPLSGIILTVQGLRSSGLARRCG